MEANYEKALKVIKNLNNKSTILDLSYFGFKELPPEISRLKNLKILDLSNNYLKTLPSSLKSITTLENINLSNNAFEEIPEVLFSFRKLVKLDLSNNLIERLNKKVVNFKNLESLFLRHNKLNLPPEIYNEKASIVLQYIDDLLKGKVRIPLLEAKLIFIGSGAVGKTSLINSLLNGKMGTPQMTDGIKIIPWRLLANKKKLKLNIWDFGGQEIMHATHKFFMTSRSLYVLVLDSRTFDQYGEYELDYWIKLIISHAGSVPIIIVLNKCDVHRIELPTMAIKEKYPNVSGFVYTSCISQEGISQLKSSIQSAISNIKHINSLIPKSYFDIKLALEKSNKDYLQYNEYEALCEKIDSELEEDSKVTLIKLLHDLGIMLNFSENKILRETQVLNPDWVTKGVYKIITNPILLDNKGKVSVSKISDILASREYPTLTEKQYITSLMEKFELAYTIALSKDTYFFPGSFPLNPPSNYIWTPKPDTLQFIYKCDILPKSIFSRFLVKIHRLIKDENYWRNGVIITKFNCESLITTDLVGKTIRISVNGARKKRIFLEIIRDKIEEILSSYKGIKYERYILLKNKQSSLICYDTLEIYEDAGKKYYFDINLKEDINVEAVLWGVDNRGDKSDIRKMIANNDIETPIGILLNRYPNNKEVLLLANRYKSFQEYLNKGVIQDFNPEKNRIIDFLLKIIESIED